MKNLIYLFSFIFLFSCGGNDDDNISPPSNVSEVKHTGSSWSYVLNSNNKTIVIYSNFSNSFTVNKNVDYTIDIKINGTSKNIKVLGFSIAKGSSNFNTTYHTNSTTINTAEITKVTIDKVY